MLTRIIVCLDVRAGRVVKGTQFEMLRDVGDPVELAQRYESEGADEITFLDISATIEERATLLDTVRRSAERLFIPLTVGGGVRSADDAARALRAGADKVSINTAAVVRPTLLGECAERFGSQCVVASIDARFAPEKGGWLVWTHGGTIRTELNAIDWARECVDRGAGEILLTSIDRDGARTGYDLELTRAVSDAVSVPVIASGGAGSARDVRDVLVAGGADAALVAGIVHDGVTSVREIKDMLERERISVRRVA
ncbi:MAG TPA: imidazole glycerol phosphate synthase subunit HisF [Gemmatimonadaceae bacterium]|nr:imidazole glycerol phosphate synthase subunit HisF [Gemmatimonadaceae bacterium]